MHDGDEHTSPPSKTSPDAAAADALPPVSTDTGLSAPTDPTSVEAPKPSPPDLPQVSADVQLVGDGLVPNDVRVELIETDDELLDMVSDDVVNEVELLDESALDMGAGMEDGQEWASDAESEMKRVKVYELVGSRWIDQGTAFCFGHFADGAALLTARSEASLQDIILTTAIRSSDVYQRQQDTLIVWTEPDGVDYALSFQDAAGCTEVWSFITEVQHHLQVNEEMNFDSSSPVIGPEPSINPNLLRNIQLPPPQLGSIAELERAIKANARNPAMKEKVCEYILREDYLRQMIELMIMAEDIEDVEALHELCNLMQTILMLNDHTMYEHVIADELFLGVVGILEYDPEFPTHKANYRDYLQENSRFHEPIPIRDPAVQRKIHYTYRLQFLKDVVLARALDDSTFNVLNSCIIFNQIDIIQHVQNDAVFLREVVRLYVDEDMFNGGGVRNRPPNSESEEPEVPKQTPEEDLTQRRQVVLLIQHLCSIGKNVQLPARLALFRSLVDRGILFTVQWALEQPTDTDESRMIVSAGGEILTVLLDHDITGVRAHVMKHIVAIEKERSVGKKSAESAQTLLQMTCKTIGTVKDLALQSQIGDALKTWLEMPHTLVDGNGSETQGNAFGKPIRKDDPNTERFLDYFYKECITTMFRPLFNLPEWSNYTDPSLRLTREEANRYMYLCDILHNIAQQHHFRSHFFLLTSNILVRVATLFKCRDKHLRHSAFRIYRLLLKQNNGNMHTLIMRGDILKPILDLTIQESRRDNLVSCSCQEYFEHMRKENNKELIKFCMTRHEKEIQTLAQSPLGAERFHSFIQRWERNNEPPPPITEESVSPEKSASVDLRSWPSDRVLDAEEEDYFNTDDDEDNPVIPSISQQFSRNSANGQMQSNMLKRKRRVALGNASKGYRPQNHTPIRSPSLGQLVDYGEDDDDVVESSDDTSSSEPEQQQPSGISLKGARQVIPAPLSAGPVLPKRAREEDEEDEWMDRIAQAGSRPESPSPGLMASDDSLGPSRPEKRRRVEDEEDDGLLARLAKKPGEQRQATITLGKPTGASDALITAAKMSGEDALAKKRFKVKLGPAFSPLVTDPDQPPVPSETDTKDGNTG